MLSIAAFYLLPFAFALVHFQATFRAWLTMLWRCNAMILLTTDYRLLCTCTSAGRRLAPTRWLAYNDPICP